MYGSPYGASFDDFERTMDVNGKGSVEPQNVQFRKSTRMKNPMQRLTYNHYMEEHCAYMLNVVNVHEPQSVEEALTKPHWKSATDDEMNELCKQNTWPLVELPHNKKAIGCKWVFTTKHKLDGSISRYKVRLVAKRYAQEYGIDYEDTFSFVAKITAIRELIAYATSKEWKIHQMDVKNAFLNGDLQEEVYMEQPEGYVDKTFPHYVCKLRKALYGLKQAPRAWTQKLNECLKEMHFVMIEVDHSLYVCHVEGNIVIIAIYVDDLIITGSDMAEISCVKEALMQRFEMKNLG